MEINHYLWFYEEIEILKISRVKVKFGKSCKMTSKHSSRWISQRHWCRNNITRVKYDIYIYIIAN